MSVPVGTVENVYFFSIRPGEIGVRGEDSLQMLRDSHKGKDAKLTDKGNGVYIGEKNKVKTYYYHEDVISKRVGLDQPEVQAGYNSYIEDNGLKTLSEAMKQLEYIPMDQLATFFKNYGLEKPVDRINRILAPKEPLDSKVTNKLSLLDDESLIRLKDKTPA
jgi:hypothetical protein